MIRHYELMLFGKKEKITFYLEKNEDEKIQQWQNFNFWVHYPFNRTFKVWYSITFLSLCIYVYIYL